MEKLKAKLAVSFSTKVLLPVVTIMVLLLAITVWLVNRRITQQYQMEAARSLRTADLFFRNARKVQRKNLVLLLLGHHGAVEPFTQPGQAGAVLG